MVIDAEAISFIDVTAAEMLATLHSDLRAEGVELLVAHDIGHHPQSRFGRRRRHAGGRSRLRNAATASAVVG
jgi:MFS superfamily sulfate permease-like transporter